MQEASESVNSLRETITGTTHAIVDFLAAREVVAFMRESATATVEWAKGLEELSQRTGISTQAAGALTASAREQGVEINSLESFMGKLSMQVARTPQHFANLGIAIRDSQGHLLSMTQIASNTLNVLEQYQVGSNRSAAAASLLGRGAAEAVANLNRFQAALDPNNLQRAAELIHGLGLEMDENGIAKAREWERAEADLGLAFLAIENQIGNALLPIVKDLGDWVAEHARNNDFKRWALEAAAGILELTRAVVGLAEFVADHNDILGIAIAGAGAELLTHGQITKGLALISAGWEASGTAADKASVRFHSAAESMKADLDKAMASVKAAASGATNITAGGGAAESGGKQFTAAESGRSKAVKERIDEFAKLNASIQEQTTFQNALAAAYVRGESAVQAVTDAQKAYEFAQRLGKNATKEQISTLEQEYLAFAKAEENAKAAQKAAQEVNKEAEEAKRLYEQSLSPIQKYDDQVIRLADAMNKGAIDAKTYAGALAQAKKELDSANTKDNSKDLGNQVSKDLIDSTSKFSDSLVKAFETGKTSSKDLKAAMLKDLLDVANQLSNTVIKHFQDQLLQSLDSATSGGGGFFGFFGSGAGATAVASQAAGGIVGVSRGLRTVPSAAFAGAARFENGGIVGLGANEVPIIAHRGEEVIPANQVGRGDRGERRAGPVNVTMNIMTPDAGSFRASQGQILADAARHISRGSRNT